MHSDETEKQWNLAAALYKHGANIEILMEHLPDMKLAEIEGAINRYRLSSRKIIQKSAETSEVEEPIDGWYDFLHNCEKLEGTSKSLPNALYLNSRSARVARNIIANRYTHLLGKNFMYAAFFEEHFRGQTAEDPDYSEIYRYLGQLLNGEEPTQMKPCSAAKILQMLSLMKEFLTDKDSVKMYKNIVENISPSYLKLEVDYVAAAKEKQKGIGLIKSEETCPLFQADNDIDQCLSDLDDEVVKGMTMPAYSTLRKILDKQIENGSNLLTVPGFNPLEMKSECLPKSASSLIMVHRRFKRAKRTVNKKKL